MTMNKRVPTAIDGVEVIAHEQAYGRHPSPHMNGKMVAFQGVTRVLLLDGTDRYVCDDCGFVGPSTRGIVAHRNSTHNRVKPPGPQYPAETLRLVMREVRKAKAERVRDYCAHVAAILNERGIATQHGSEWNASIVSRLWTAYRDRFKTRSSSPKHDTRPSDVDIADLTTIKEWIRVMPEVEAAVMRVVNKLAEVSTRAAEATDELVEKARRWDAIQELMRGQ